MQQTLVIIVRQKTALLLSSLPETLSSYVVSFLPKGYSTQNITATIPNPVSQQDLFLQRLLARCLRQRKPHVCFPVLPAYMRGSFSGKWEQDQLQNGKAAGGSFTGSSGSNWRQSNQESFSVSTLILMQERNYLDKKQFQHFGLTLDMGANQRLIWDLQCSRVGKETNTLVRRDQ